MSTLRPASLFRAAAAAALLFGCSGCLMSALISSLLPPSKEAREIRVFSEKAVLLDLPFEKQATPNLCGLAAVEMLTRYHKKPLAEPQRAILAREAEANQGITGATLKQALEASGYYVAVFQGTLDAEETGVYHHIDLQRPLIVMLESSQDQTNHYCLVTGYDPERRMIALMDPGYGPAGARLEKFLNGWEKANRFTLLALPVEPPSTNPQKGVE